MLTEVEFKLAIDNFRERVRRADMLVGGGVLFLFLAAITAVYVQGKIDEDPQATSLTFLILWACISAALILYKTIHVPKLPKICGICCPACSRPARIKDEKLIIETHRCPYCGQQFCN